MRPYHPKRLRRFARSALVALAATAPLLACNSDNRSSITAPSPPVPTLGVNLGSGSLALFQGQRGTVAVYLDRNGGFSGAVVLAVTGAPTDVTATFDPPLVTEEKSGSTLTIETTKATLPGTYSLRVTGSGSGVTNESASLVLSILPAPTAAITVQFITNDLVFTVLGDSWTWGDVIVTRGSGYTGPVDLTVEGLPSGVTARFEPASLDGNATKSQVTFTAAGDAATGSTYPTIRATGVGVPDGTTVFWFAVFPPWQSGKR